MFCRKEKIAQLRVTQAVSLRRKIGLAQLARLSLRQNRVRRKIGAGAS